MGIGFGIGYMASGSGGGPGDSYGGHGWIGDDDGKLISSTTLTRISVVDKLEKLSRVEKIIDVNNEDLKQSKVSQPAIYASHMFGGSPYKVYGVQIATTPLHSPNSLVFHGESIGRALTTISGNGLIKNDMIMVYKLHKNEYGKIDGEFYDNSKNMINASQVFDFSFETKCVKVLNNKFHRNILGWDGEGKIMCYKLHKDEYGKVEALTGNIKSECDPKSLEKVIRLRVLVKYFGDTDGSLCNFVCLNFMMGQLDKVAQKLYVDGDIVLSYALKEVMHKILCDWFRYKSRVDIPSADCFTISSLFVAYTCSFSMFKGQEIRAYLTKYGLFIALGVEKNLVSFNFLFARLCETGRESVAWDLFYAMAGEKTDFTMTTVVNTCRLLTETGVPSSVSTSLDVVIIIVSMNQSGFSFEICCWLKSDNVPPKDEIILEVINKMSKVLSTSEVSHLSGDDFKKRIVNWLALNVKNVGIINLMDKQDLQHDLRNKRMCEGTDLYSTIATKNGELLYAKNSTSSVKMDTYSKVLRTIIVDETALHLACRRGNSDLVNAIWQYKEADVTVFKRWVDLASAEEIADAIDIESPLGTSLCMAAALKEDHEVEGREIVRILFAARADPTAQDNQHRRTTLRTAAVSNDVELVKSILNVEVDVNLKNVHNTIPLHVALARGAKSCAGPLLSAGANCNLPDDEGCNQICLEPLSLAPFGSLCSCVFPMKVKLLFDVSLLAIFPVINELEIEVAEGTYLKQSQVVITGASADDLILERTAVDINLVPLGEKFDNTTATLTYERLWQKKVPLNKTLFGTYGVASITYPGLPSLPPSGGQHSSGPSGSARKQYPITAFFINKSQKMNTRTMLVISSSAVTVLVVCIGAVIVLLNCRKDGRPSNDVRHAYTSFVNRRSGIVSVSSSPTSSKSASLVFTRDKQNGDRELIAEVEMLSRLHHRDLVKLIEICLERHTCCLIYKVVPNGSVESHLHGVDKRMRSLEWDARLKIALSAARGLAYLHEDSNPRVIHRNFKASNVLLEDEFTPKVSDYCSPENSKFHLEDKVSLWGRGIVMTQVLHNYKAKSMKAVKG